MKNNLSFKKSLLILLISIISLNSFKSFSQANPRFVNVDNITDIVKIKNFGTASVDISTYYICSKFICGQLSNTSFTIVSGSYVLNPNDEVEINTSAIVPLDNVSADVDLYMNASFSSPTAIQDFMQYGSGGNGRENIAVIAGLWNSGDFISTANPFEYIGNGSQNGVTFWASNLIIGGTISTSNETNICIDASSDNISFSKIGEAGDFFNWIFVKSGNITHIDPGFPFDFNALGIGITEVYNISSDASLTGLSVGNPLSGLGGNFDLSNSISVNGTTATAGSIRFSDNSTSLVACTGSSETIFNVNITGQETNLDYIIVYTDTSNIIEGYSLTNSVDLSSSPDGICWLYGYSYKSGVSPLPTIGTNISTLDTGVCEDVTNAYITVFKQSPEGGTVTFSDGDSMKNVCANVSSDANFSLNTTSTNPDFEYDFIVTDSSGNILGTHNTSLIDFSIYSASSVINIYGWSHNGYPNPTLGTAITSINDSCNEVSTNFAAIYFYTPDAGTLTYSDLSTSQTVCFTAGTVISLIDSSSNPLNYQYLVTDLSGVIQTISSSANINTGSYATGSYNIYAWSSGDSVSLVVGNNISALPSACSDLSSPISLIVDEADGATISLTDTSTTLTLCAGSPNSFSVDFLNTTSSNFEYSYIITDSSDIIVSIENSSSIDFSASTLTSCKVYGWSHQDITNPTVGSNISTVNGSCSEISSNFVTITKETPDAGNLQFLSGDTTLTFCVDDPLVNVSFSNDATTGLTYDYLITDNLGNVLSTISTASLDMTSYAVGEYRIYGWITDGNPTLTVGTNVSILSAVCTDLSSNFLTVIIDDPIGSTIEIAGSGDTSINFCAGGTNTSIDVITNTTATSLDYIYIVTDDLGEILSFQTATTIDFSASASGTCRVYGWSRIDISDPIIGSNISTLTDPCGDLSTNFITVTKEDLNAGSLTFTDLSTSTTICSGNASVDVVATGQSSGYDFRYVITNSSNTILGFTSSTNIDMSSYPTGTCRIYTYINEDVTDPVINASVLSLSIPFCSEISSTFIEVIKEDPDAGTITLSDNSSSLTLCNSSTSIDVVNTSSSSSAFSYYYIITDSSGEILDFQTSSTIDLSLYSETSYIIYGWSFIDVIDPIIGNNISSLTSSCGELTTTQVDVSIINLDAGTISADVTDFCTDDSTPDLMTVTTTSTELNYEYFVTDQFDNIVFGPTSISQIDFDGFAQSSIRIYGIAYEGTLVLGTDLTTITADCYSLSSNFIDVNLFTGIDCGDLSTDTEVIFPTVFSPNNDGINDVFVIENIHRYPDSKLQIYNRYGALLYEKIGYENDWNGISSEGIYVESSITNLPSGNYYYYLELNNEALTINNEPLHGWFYISY